MARRIERVPDLTAPPPVKEETNWDVVAREAMYNRAARSFRMLAPPPKLTVSEWTARYQVLSSVNSAEPGPWDIERAPYQTEMMDAVNEPAVETVVFMTSAQIGKSSILNNIIAYYIDRDPSPILLVQPTVDLSEAYSKERLQPMFDECPKLKGLIAPARTRDSGNTVLTKKFPGGNLSLVGANAPSGLASRPIRIVLCDEVDRFPASAGAEGDPVGLARKRTATFWNRKIVLTSTPTVKDLSRIEKAFAESDQRRYHVPCPLCGHYQVLRWAGIEWPKDVDGKPVTAKTVYRCESCGDPLPEEFKGQMLRQGEWRPGNLDAGGKVRGYHLNALYSPWLRWEELADEWLKCKDDPVQLKVFVNTVLGECWEEQGEAVEAHTLAVRLEEYPAEVPDGVGVLTASVDVQNDRLEAQVVGWGQGEEAWLIAFNQIMGDPGRMEVWDDLDHWLKQRFTTESGKGLGIACCLVDSGGHHADQVYRFCQARSARRVYACKGHSKPGAEIVGRPSLNNKYRIKLFMIGTDSAKDALFSRLKVKAPGPGFVHLPVWVDHEYLEQLTSEKAVTRYIRGKGAKREYIKTRARNEALDLTIYCMAALRVLGAPVIRTLGQRARRLAARVEGEKPMATPPEMAPVQDEKPVELPQPQSEPKRPTRPAPARRRTSGWMSGGGGGGWVGGWR